MADQFCRIVDTTICDQTLGSDATQSVLTTDSNTSYIIRDIYKTDSSTDSTQCFKGDLVMDGHSVHKSLSTSASGSLIVPPNSNLCYKDTSGNFPLIFNDVEEQFLTCNCCIRINRYETVSGSLDGSKTLTCVSTQYLPCTGGCHGNTGRSGIWLDCNNNTAWFNYSDGNSDNTLRRICYSYGDGGATCSSQIFCYSGSYCGFAFNDCVVAQGVSNNIRFYSDVCGGPCCCYLNFYINSINPSSYSTYSDIGVSAAPPSSTGFHKYCRGWVNRPGGGCACFITWGHVDLCCICSGASACGGCVGCLYPPDFTTSPGCLICSNAQGSNKKFGIWYNQCYCDWYIWWANNSGERIFMNRPGIRDTSNDSFRVICPSNFGFGDGQPGESSFLADDGCRLYSIVSCSCKSWSVVLDDLWDNGNGATFNSQSYEVYSACYKCPIAYDCKPPRGFFVISSLDATKKSCDSSVDPTSKLTFYGIKST